jgi:hypothetical protein
VARDYSVTFLVTVHLHVKDDDAIERVERETGDFREFAYAFPEGEREEGAVEMLAYNVGCRDRPLSSLDGWADLPDDAVEARVAWQLDEWERIA